MSSKTLYLRALSLARTADDCCLGAGCLGAICEDDYWPLALENRVLRDDALLHAGFGGKLVHHLEHRLLENCAQATGAGIALDGLLGDRLEGVFLELEADVVILEELAVLLGERVLGLGQDLDQGLLIELLESRDDRQAADE